MTRRCTALAALALLVLFFAANGAAASPTPLSALAAQPDWRAHLKPVRPIDTLPTLQIEVCDACVLTREDLSAIKKAYAIAAYNAGYRIDALSTMHVKILETGRMANGAPFARGETGGMWFKVGNPRPGESIGSVAGRVTFGILSKSR